MPVFFKRIRKNKVWKKRYGFLLLCIVLLTVAKSFSQDFGQDYRKWQKTFENIRTFSTKMDITVYDNYQTKSIVQKRKASVLKNNNNFLMHIDDLEIVYADSLSLMVNHSSKDMTLGSYNPDSVNFSQNMYSIDTLLGKLDRVLYLGEENNTKNYKIFLKKNMVREMVLSFNANTAILEKVLYFYNKELALNSSVVEVELKSTKLNSSDGEAMISLHKYIEVKSGIIVPSHAFSTYTLHYDH